MRRLNGSLTLLVGLLGLPVVWGCAATPPTGVTLTPAPSSPQPAGTPVVWTATATGGTAPQFRFWVLPPGGSFILAQDYSSSNIFPWTPTQHGTYVVCVWAKSSGSSADKEADACQGFLVTTPVTSVTLTANPLSPQPAGTPVVWTATATGGTAPQFRYWVLPQGGAWTVGQGYSGSPTFPWTPSSTGTYMVCVWARSGSSTADRDADRCLAYTVTPPPGGGTSLSRRATSS